MSRFVSAAMVLLWLRQGASAAQTTGDFPITARLAIRSVQDVLHAASSAACTIETSRPTLAFGSWYRPTGAGTETVTINPISGPPTTDLIEASGSSISRGDVIVRPGSNPEINWTWPAWPQLTSHSGSQMLSFAGAAAYNRSWNPGWTTLDPPLSVPSGASMPEVQFQFGRTVGGISGSTLADSFSANVEFQFTCS